MREWPATPLDVFRRELQLHPWHFWGFAGTGKARVTAQCLGLLRQYAWQHADAVSRDDVRQALLTAEHRLLEYLRFPIAPLFLESTLAWPGGRYDGDGRWRALALPYGEVRAIGIETYTHLDTVALVYSDRDGDGVNETMTGTALVPAGTLASELGMYISAADRFDGSTVAERWRVGPLAITVMGTTATIQGPAWLCARPVLYEGLDARPNGLDPLDATNFVTTLELHRRVASAAGTTAATAGAVLSWTATPCHDGDPAGLATAVARVGIQSARLGLVAPVQAIYNSTDGVWQATPDALAACRQADYVTVRYLAGIPPLPDGAPPQPWATLVARYAAAELQRPICDGKGAGQEVARWQKDLSQTGNTDELFQAPRDVDNPFGSRRGHIYAWREAARYALGQSISAG